jgi:hypothetical protein
MTVILNRGRHGSRSFAPEDPRDAWDRAHGQLALHGLSLGDMTLAGDTITIDASSFYTWEPVNWPPSHEVVVCHARATGSQDTRYDGPPRKYQHGQPEPRDPISVSIFMFVMRVLYFGVAALLTILILGRT